MNIKDTNKTDVVPSNDRLRQERIWRNWRQQDVADQIGTTVVTANRWERGNQQPSAYFRIKLCALFGKNAAELGLVEANSSPSLPTEIEAAGELQIRSSPIDMPTLWTVPYLRNPCFTGREELLHLIDQHFAIVRQDETTTTHRAVLTQPQAIKGLGGIGKTQIAVEYAYRAREHNQYTHTLWMNAASKEALMTSFTTLAELLPDFPAKSETNQQKLVEAIKRWLEQCKQPWLLIFDNADDLSLIQGCVPHHGNGNILITTRANAVGSLAISIEVEKMGFIEGTQLLLRRAQRFDDASDEQMNKAGDIVVALDHFPLAIEQAGAYIEETGCSFSNYLQLYQNHRAALLARRGAQTMNYPDSVATTWLLSFQKVEQANPAAAELLRLCAFLAPDTIPEELLTDGAQNWPPLLQQAAANLFAFNQMIESLLAFSLVKRLTENHLLSIHRLVQVVQMDMMDPEEQRQWATRVVTAMNTMFPPDPRNVIASWSQCLRYLDQAQGCVTLIQQWNLLLPEGADLLERTGIYLYEHAFYTIAEPLFQHALHIWEHIRGPEHERIAPLLYNLAILYREQGKYAEAESFFQRALHIWKYTEKPEHADIATALRGLAVIYCKQGRFTEAEPLFQHALHIYEQSGEPENAQVASLLSNLANLYRIQGKYTEAEPLFRRALHIYEQSGEPEHPEAASSISNLATLYSTQGKYTEAEPLYLHALHTREQTWGVEHPKVAASLHGLGNLYSTQGKYAEAELLYQRALHIYEQTGGPEHPEVASSLNCLAESYCEQGKYAEAEPLYQRALHIYEHLGGPEHPNISFSLHGLGNLYSTQGKYAEAELLHQRALHIREHLVGPEHPNMASSLHGLGNLYLMQGKYTKAEPLLQRAFSIYEHALGPDNPTSAETMHTLASLQEAQGNIEEATSLYHRALTIREKVYGQQHPKTIATRERLHVVSVVLNQMESPSIFSAHII